MNMNPLLEEYLAEERRRDITKELIDIHLQEHALRSTVYRPNLFSRSMQGLGQWLIVRGEKMVTRYEVPANRPPTADRIKKPAALPTAYRLFRVSR